MSSEFSRALSLLRQERGVSQRTAAKDLGVSQALLSHYENGIREPGLAFVVRACEYYHVSADFILGRTLSKEGNMLSEQDVLNIAEPGNVLQGGVMATLQSKLIGGAAGVLFGLLGKTGDKAAINAAGQYLSAAIYRLYRHLYHAAGANEDFFSLSWEDLSLSQADMTLAERAYCHALRTGNKEMFPDLTPAALSAEYPGRSQSLTQVLGTADKRSQKLTD